METLAINNATLSTKPNCLICRKIFDTPKILPCGDTFCEGCIREYINSRGYDVFGFFPCPVCQLGITIPLGGISQFYSNLNIIPPSQPTFNNSEKPKSILSMKDPVGLSVTDDNLIVVTDLFESKIMIFNLEHQMISCFSCKEKIYSCAVSFNNTILATNLEHGQPLLLELNLAGKRCGLKKTLNKMESTYGIAVLREPMEYVVSVVESSTLYVLNESGKLIKKISGKALLGHPYNLCTNQNNDILVSDRLNHCVKILDRNGKLKLMIGGMGTSKDCLFEPSGICCDRNNNIIVADSGNRSIKLFTKCGKFNQVLMDFNQPIEKPVNVALTKNNKYLVVLVNGCKSRFLVLDYDIPSKNRTLQCV